MRLHLGPLPDEFAPDNSWHAIHEPGPILMQFLAIPFGFGAATLSFLLWQVFGLPSSMQVRGSDASIFLLTLVLSLAVLIIVHELLHAIVHPHFGCSPRTVIGAWPSRMLFYAHYSGPLTRDRFLLVFLMPFLVISVLPIVMAAIGVIPHSLMFWPAWFSVWNALFASGDLLGIALIFFQVPRAAIVQNQGWRTYWKLS